MGANSTQAVAITAFFLGAVAIPTAAFFGGIVMVLIGVALLGVSVVMFQKCKPWENMENGGSR
jgi:hypothetical protein